jgi:uncharacterized membrane protein YdbT with pleckstrin-like domain
MPDNSLPEEAVKISRIWLYLPVARLASSSLTSFFMVFIAIIVSLLFTSPDGKHPLFFLFVPFLLFCVAAYFLNLLGSSVGVIYNHLYAANFHIYLTEKYLVVKKGILSKSERTLPYGVIQNVTVGRTFIDYLFGLSTVIIENASNGGFGGEGLGVGDNLISIPGLLEADADRLRIEILSKLNLFASQTAKQGL